MMEYVRFDKMLILIMLVLPLRVCLAADDSEIARCVVLSMSYIDNPARSRASLAFARGLCEGDDTRFARILGELAHTNDAKIAECMISLLVQYGTSAQLPFLYSQATNVEYGADAVRSILRIEGITSNSVAMVDRYLSLTNKESRLDRENICKFMLDRFAGPQSPDGIRNVVEQSVLGFAMSNTVYNEYFDESLAQRISGYRYSRRRLDILRRARQIMEISYNESFITNAINELVAYPEADLPD